MEEEARARSYVITSASIVQCPHGGAVNFNQVLEAMVVERGYAIPADTVVGIDGCPHAPSCMQVVWYPPASGVTVEERIVLTTMTPGLCETGHQEPVGPPIVIENQLRVEA